MTGLIRGLRALTRRLSIAIVATLAMVVSARQYDMTTFLGLRAGTSARSVLSPLREEPNRQIRESIHQFTDLPL